MGAIVINDDRKKRETEQVLFFFACLASVPIQLGANKNNSLCATQFISDIDSRWNVLGETADNRKNDEIENNISRSSRYSNVPCYLSQSSGIFNDIKLNIDDCNEFCKDGTALLLLQHLFYCDHNEKLEE